MNNEPTMKDKTVDWSISQQLLEWTNKSMELKYVVLVNCNIKADKVWNKKEN